MSDILLYTSIFGPYDELKEVPAQTIRHVARCYTDQDFKTATWQLSERKLEFGRDTMLTSRYYKINPAISDYEFCIYIDGSFQIRRSDFLEFMLDNLTGHQIVFFKHPWRDCIYDEVGACLATRKYNHKDLRRQALKYAGENIPKHHGLWACSAFAYRNNRSVTQFREAWWQELKSTSTMDQISLPYVIRKQAFDENIKTIDLHVFDNEYLEWMGHKTEYIARQNLSFVLPALARLRSILRV